MVGFGSSNCSQQSSFDLSQLDRLFPSAKLFSKPVIHPLDTDFDSPFQLYKTLHPHYSKSFLLESSSGAPEFSRYTFMGVDPVATLTFSEGTFYLDRSPICSPSSPVDFLDYLYRKYLLPAEDPSFRYMGGMVGYFGYGFINAAGDLPDIERTAGSFPDLEMGIYLDGFIHDSREDELYYFSHLDDRSDQLLEAARGSGSGDCGEGFCLRAPRVDLNEDQFGERVSRIKELITAGDIYQAVLSKKVEGSLKGDPFQAYCDLRSLNPSPYMFHLHFGERRVIGTSPEMLAAVEAGEVTTFPIAGTRPLGGTKEERKQLSNELLSDEKERAEHNMLVDLARNDVGRISRVGSVRLPQYMSIKKFSHVQHIVSEVRGELLPDCTAVEALAALFPAGTVTGAPKYRAIQVIDELEASARGPYAGSVGYLSMGGNMDTCITIRSLFIQGRKAMLRAGAGIVADSQGSAEWRETEDKLRVMRQVLEGGAS